MSASGRGERGGRGGSAGAPQDRSGEDPGLPDPDDPRSPLFDDDDEGLPEPASRPPDASLDDAGRGGRDASSALFDLRVEIATCFGIGHIKFAPGTFGSAAALPFAVVLHPLGPALYLTVTAIVLLIAIWSASAAVQRLGVKDPGQVVIDEVAGQLVALAFVPPTLLGVAMGFFVFRFFDIVKPFPADRLEHLPGGPGVVLDDIAAGVYACLVVHAGLRLLQFAGS